MLASASLSRKAIPGTFTPRAPRCGRVSAKERKTFQHGSIRRLATHVEPTPEEEVGEDVYESPIPPSGYTSRHMLSIFPPMPVLDKLQDIQTKIANRTRITVIPRSSMQIRLVPLGTSLAEPGKVRQMMQIMDKVARQTKPIEIEIGGVGCIPKWSKPREVFASLEAGREPVKTLIKQLEVELKEAQFMIDEPGAVRHRTRIPLGVWEDVYVTTLQGDLAKEVSDTIGHYTQASFLANQMVLLEQKPDSTLVPVHVALFGTTLPVKKRARYKTLL